MSFHVRKTGSSDLGRLLRVAPQIEVRMTWEDHETRWRDQGTKAGAGAAQHGYMGKIKVKSWHICQTTVPNERTSSHAALSNCESSEISQLWSLFGYSAGARIIVALRFVCDVLERLRLLKNNLKVWDIWEDENSNPGKIPLRGTMVWTSMCKLGCRLGFGTVCY